MRRLVFAFLVLVCGRCLPSEAQVRWVGIDDRVANLMAHHQEKDEWCWAASAQMILNYYGIPVTQAAIVNRIHGDYEDNPGSDYDISSSLDGWVPLAGVRKVVHAEQHDGLPPPFNLVQQLSQGHPILLTFATGPNSGHAVVITAAGYIQNGNGGITIMSLVYRDPWPSAVNQFNAGRVQVDGPALMPLYQRTKSHWIVTVGLSQ